MDYHFTVNTYKDPSTGKEFSNPLVNIENKEKYGWFFQDEIQNLSLNVPYLKEISEKLGALMSGKSSFYEGFGHQVYMIECDKKQAKVKNMQEGEAVEATIPTKDIYRLIKDWYQYVVDFDKIKNGNAGEKATPVVDSGSFAFKKIDLPAGTTNKEIHSQEITQKELPLTIEVGKNKNLRFDIAAPLKSRMWPDKLNAKKQVEQLTKLLEADVSFTKRGTYYIKKQSTSHSLNTLYLSIGVLDGKKCLVSYYYGEKQPFVYLTYLDTVIQLEK